MKKIDLLILSTFIPILALDCYFTYKDINKFKPVIGFGSETPYRLNFIEGILIIELGLILLLTITKIRNNSIIINWIYNHSRHQKGIPIFLILGIMCIIMGIICFVP
jgi:hypothetical protein